MGVCEKERMGRCLVDESLTLTRCHSFMKPWKGRNPSVVKPTTYGHKGENFFFFFHNLLLLFIFYFRSFHGTMRADPAVAGTG